MNEVGAIYLPNYSLTNLLQKDHLLELIEKDPEMNCFILDTGYKNLFPENLCYLYICIFNLFS